MGHSARATSLFPSLYPLLIDQAIARPGLPNQARRGGCGSGTRALGSRAAAARLGATGAGEGTALDGLCQILILATKRGSRNLPPPGVLSFPDGGSLKRLLLMRQLPGASEGTLQPRSKASLLLPRQGAAWTCMRMGTLTEQMVSQARRMAPYMAMEPVQATSLEARSGACLGPISAEPKRTSCEPSQSSLSAAKTGAASTAPKQAPLPYSRALQRMQA